MPGERLIAVAVPLPLQEPLTYAVPDALPLPPRGVRVIVPVGARRAVGLSLGPAAAPAGDGERKLRQVEAVLDDAPLLPEKLLDLAAWVSDYYLAPPGECYRLLLPPAGLRGSRAQVRLADGARSEEPVAVALREGPLNLGALARKLGRDPSAQLARLRRDGVVVVDQEIGGPGFRELQVAVLEDGIVETRGPAQAEVVARLQAAGGRARVNELVRDRPSLRQAIARLAELGRLRLESERDLRSPGAMPGGTAARPEASADQLQVLSALLPAVEAGGFRPFLLHGVTGAGKTEVYFRTAEAVLARGRSVLLLVPEIALTPLLVRASLARFGRAVAVLHSELSTGERHDQWWRLRDGEVRIAVGARSAVFAPMPDLGLIVVDEEHEAAYKQEETPRYHGRDVAVMRASLEGAVVVLGSATPSVESSFNAGRGKYTKLELPSRITPRGLPSVEVLDRRELIKAGSDPILSPALREALQARLERREQALLLLNRRGWATSLLCRECGEQAACPNCSVCLALHQGGRVALCHYCGHRVKTPEACPSCKGEYLRLTGYGTERVVDAVRLALPEARVERLDRDLAQRRGALQRVLSAFEAGEIDILVGTQMIAKGHDFPRVTLVGVIDADVGLGLPDFRSAERTFQLLTQVAGRAGRGDVAGEVLLQSHLPDHYALRLACAQDYAGFYEQETVFRRSMGYPPYGALANLIVRSAQAAQAEGLARSLAEDLRGRAQGRYRVLGPAFAPLARLKTEHRVQVLLKGDRGALRGALRAALVARLGPLRWPGVVVDVDPVSLL